VSEHKLNGLPRRNIPDDSQLHILYYWQRGKPIAAFLIFNKFEANMKIFLDDTKMSENEV
jgi:hypothetical protein